MSSPVSFNFAKCAEMSCAVNDLVKNTAGDIILSDSGVSVMINFLKETRINDEIWTISGIKLPAKGTAARIAFKSFSKITQPIEKTAFL